ncbi:MAG: ATP-binding protein [Desulfobacteraceae bacterium]|nr:ATP-binding protein [Desulfobacteraceae bacterium]
MTSKRKTVSPTESRRSPGPFLQPLAVALVSLVLVSLALITGLMDLRTLDKTLVGYMEKRGLDIIGKIQQTAKHNFQALHHASQTDPEQIADSGFTDETFSLRESIVLDLLDVAQRIDFERKENRIDDKELISIASLEDLYLVVLFDDHGVITFKNRPVPESLLVSAAPVIKGEEEIKVDLFGRHGKGDQMRALALRRKWGKGTVVLVLNDENFLFWSLRVSIGRAVEEVGPGADTGYFVVTDKRGRIIFQWVEDAGMAKENDSIPGIFTKNREAPGQKLDWGGRKMLEVVAPIHIGVDVICTARLSLSTATADQMLKKEQGRGLIFMCFMVFIAIISMWFLYRNQNRHLAKMREMERRLHQAERLSAMGRLAAGVAHEIRNPLNAISMACQRLQKDNLLQLTGIIRDEIRRLNHIIEEFIAFSRMRKLELKNNDLIELLGQIALLVREEAASQGITIETDWSDSPLMVLIDFDRIKQALFNVVKNAMEAISGTGSITLSVEQEGKGWVKITISDTGSGLTREELEQIFNPDYTTKEKGLGLGLALAHEIIQGHSGEIRVMSEPGTGTTFEVLLPINLGGS